MVLVNEVLGLQQGAEERAGESARQGAGNADVVICPFRQRVHQGGEQAFVVEDDKRVPTVLPGHVLEYVGEDFCLAGVLGAFHDPEPDVLEVVGDVLVLQMPVQIRIRAVSAQEMPGFLLGILHVITVGIPQYVGFSGPDQAFDNLLFGSGQGVEAGEEVEAISGQPVLEQAGQVLAGNTSGKPGIGATFG